MKPAPAQPSDPSGTAAEAAVDLTVVIPAYNEENRLAPTLTAVRAHLESLEPLSWELIVVDDGSADGTAAVAEAAAAEEPRVRLLRTPANRGKGHAVRTGVLASRGRRVLVTDADLATPIEELTPLQRRLDEGVAAAVGSRALPESRIAVRQNPVREVMGRLGSGLIRAAAVPGIRDTQCGFKLFDGDKVRTAFEGSRLDGWSYDVEILRFFHQMAWEVAEVPVRWAHQPGSKVRPFAYPTVLADLVRLRWRAVRPEQIAIPAIFLVLAFFLYGGLWGGLGGAYLADSGSDQQQWEWFFAVTADNVAHLRNPLFTDLQNAPLGVNLMANTAMLGLSVPLAPLTLALGAHVTWAVVLTGGLTATACSWYWLIARRFVRSRWAAALGGGFCAFAPPMISHGTAHPNFAVLFMMPLIIDRALRLCEGRRPTRDAVVLGLFLAYQVFLGEEALLLAVTGMLLFAFGYAVASPDVAKAVAPPLLRGLGIAALVAVPLVMVPLAWQFFGPQSYRSVLHGQVGNHPMALLEFATRSLAGDEHVAASLSLNRTEENAFFGWPLVVLAVALVVHLRDQPRVRALGFTALAAAVLSLGQNIPLPGTGKTLPGPWRVVAPLPVFESVIESRMAMVCVPALGILLALGCDRLVQRRVRSERESSRRILGAAALVVAVLPLFPTPYRTVERAPVPAFVSDGTWREYVRPGRSLVPVPVPSPADTTALGWQIDAGLGFRIPGGYFNGPWGPERIGIYGPQPRPTSELLRKVRETGRVPVIGPQQRREFGWDLDFWRADVLVLAGQDNDEALRTAVTALAGRQPKRAADVWVWDVRAGR
ncbi:MULTISPECIES: dolichyl-phosphate beta-glucosyltransferase [Streptomyces]|uniref:dolichyl-phosphate beta-glucosyltransferase n=1 Tax=Streptomyces griseocarneus TaxID=51201 RepID=A0ABX7RZA1_9ACTN|nr:MULTISPECIES: dolichyl-phosphate beta-glucosyltransferase [Streptomyces]QSY52163.1 glycosyltransferase family 2 protein [Streptomyces griseocarneus]